MFKAHLLWVTRKYCDEAFAAACEFKINKRKVTNATTLQHNHADKYASFTCCENKYSKTFSAVPPHGQLPAYLHAQMKLAFNDFTSACFLAPSIGAYG